jgi:hypothetical protein
VCTRHVRAVGIGGAFDAGKDRDGGGPTAVDRLRNTFALQRVHQPGGITDEEHPIVGWSRAHQSHLEPCTQRPRRRHPFPRVEHSEPARVFDERVEIVRGASAPTPIGEHRDTEADVRASVTRGKRPSVPGKTRRGGRRPEHDVRHLDQFVAVRAHREPPQHPARVDETGDVRNAARRTVGADDHIALQPSCVPTRRRRHYEPGEAIVVTKRLVGTTFEELGARIDRRAQERRIELRARHDDAVAGIGAAGGGREPDTVPRRSDDDHVADTSRLGHVDVQVGQQLHAPWPDEVTAGLVTRERGLVDERDSCAAPRQHEGGGATGRTRTDHDNVELRAGHALFPLRCRTVRCSREEDPCSTSVSIRTASHRTCSVRSRVATTCSKSCSPSGRTGDGGAQ